MKDYKNHAAETVGPGESRLFSDGSVVVRHENLPWIPTGLPGVDFKCLNIDWDRHMYVVLQRAPAGTCAPEHYHYGPNHTFVLEGGFKYEHGDIGKGDYLCESSDIFHDGQAGDEDMLLIGVVFDGVGPLGDNGKPELENTLDCITVYNLAKEAGAAGHLLPPPASYKRHAMWQHANAYGYETAA